MSSVTYNEQWKAAMVDLHDQLAAEAPEDPSRLSKDPSEVFQQQATLYVKYVQILRRLEDSYDQIVHPQKRIDVRKVLENVIGRLLEIKEVLLKIELTDYVRFDDLLVDLKMGPEVLEMPVPRYFVDDRNKELEEREKLLDALTAQYRTNETADEAEENSMSIEEAVAIIQLNERGRQGRQRARLMKEIRRQEERERRAMEFGEPEIDPHNAAIAIQKTWRGYAARVQTERMREEEAVFIGMARPRVGGAQDPKSKAEQTRAHRKLVQAQNEQEYHQALITIKQKIYELEGPDMKEHMMDDIRSWFIAYREQHGKFPDYPSEADGGSATIFKEPEAADEDAAAEKEKEAEKDKPKSRLASRKGGPSKGGKSGKGKKGDEAETDVIEVPVSQFLKNIQDCTAHFQRVWQYRDESNNFSQKYDAELVKDELRPEVEVDIRNQVDELLRVELDNLKMAVERDKKKKKSKGGKDGAKKKKKAAKKGGEGKGGRKKKKKDLTADRSIESLYAELVLHNIIRKNDKIRISDYIGETNFLGSTMRDANIDIDPSMADIRRVITEYCVLPLGCEPLHQTGVPIKTVLFYGPRQSGKTMLAHAVAHETGANFFELSPSVIAGKFGGRAITMALHTVFKVAKVLAPSVIYIDNFERVFASDRRRRDGGDNPSRMKKDLIKEVKALTPEDRVLVIGNSRKPWDADFRSMVPFLSKAFYLPRPDYASRRLLWARLIDARVDGLADKIDLQILSHISEGFTSGMISTAVAKVLNPQRLKKSDKKPVTTEEFIVPLARLEPVYAQEYEEFRKWTAKLPLSKARKKKMLGDDDEEETAKAGRTTAGKGSKRK